jgi:hypothetical protein
MYQIIDKKFNNSIKRSKKNTVNVELSIPKSHYVGYMHVTISKRNYSAKI